MKKSVAKLVPGTLAAGTAVLFLADPSQAEAQLHHVDQVIYGMDCAPCAYGIERRLGGFDGVDAVTLSLNEGKAVLELAEENELTLKAVREAIRRGGFDPRETEIRAAGTFSVNDEGSPFLELETGERFALREETPDAWETLGEIDAGERVLLRGRVPATDEIEDTEAPLPLEVLEAESNPPT